MNAMLVVVRYSFQRSFTYIIHMNFHTYFPPLIKPQQPSIANGPSSLRELCFEI